MSGKLPPESVNPFPITVAALTVTAAVPVDDRVTDCVAGVFKVTLPNARVVALMLNVGVPAPSCRAKVFDILPALAVSVTICVVLTEETVAVKPPLIAPDGTVAVAGTATAVLLLVRLTANPPLGAAVVSVTVQLSVPVVVIDPLLQLIPLNTGATAPSCKAKVFDDPPAIAVSVAVCAGLTEETVAAKLALFAPAGTVTVAGTATAELLLARLTAIPPLAAAAFNVTVQLSVPVAVIDPLLQLTPLKTGTPVPLKPTRVELPVEELLVMVNCPVAAPAVAGSNCTVRVAV